MPLSVRYAKGYGTTSYFPLSAITDRLYARNQLFVWQKQGGGMDEEEGQQGIRLTATVFEVEQGQEGIQDGAHRDEDRETHDPPGETIDIRLVSLSPARRKPCLLPSEQSVLQSVVERARRSGSRRRSRDGSMDEIPSQGVCLRDSMRKDRAEPLIEQDDLNSKQRS